MKLFIVLVACLLLVRGEDAKSDDVKPQAEKDDFLLGLAAHAIHGTLGAAHGAVNLVGHVLIGDEELADIQALDKELDALAPDAEEEKQDFLLGLFHHAVHGVLGVGHHALNLIGHVVGDENEEAKLDEIFKANNVIKPDYQPTSHEDEQEKEDFIFGLLHHAVRGVLGAAHGVLHLAGHIIGDEKEPSDSILSIGLIRHATRQVAICPIHHAGHILGDNAQKQDNQAMKDEDKAKLDAAILAAAAKTDNKEKKDFLLGLAHHYVKGCLNVGHHALNLVGHIIGDNKQVSLEDVDAVLARLSKTDNAEERDFLLGLIHHAARGILGAAHGVLHLAGHIIGDEQVKDFNTIVAAYAKADTQEKKDFLLGLIHHAVHGVLGAAHGVLHLAGHILGDEHLSSKDVNSLLTALSKADTRQEKDFLLGLVHHYVKGCVNVGHHALNLVGNILGDNEVSLKDVDAILARLSKTDNQQEKDFLLGLIHHAARGILGAAHGVLHLAGHIIGDEEVKDFNAIVSAYAKADTQEKKDFLFGLIHHAVRGVLGAAHGVLHLAGHILGDEHLSSKDVNALFTALSSADTRQEKDFLLGLAHHYVKGCLNVGHHALNLVGHIIGDNKLSLDDVDAVLDEIANTDNQEKKDFLLGLIHHAVRGVLGAAHGILHLAGHIVGDEKTTDIKAVLDAISKTDNQEKKDFLLGLIHHAVRGVLSVGHHALNLVGHIVGDNKDVSARDIEGVLDEISKTDNQEKKDFLLGLIHHAAHGVLNVAHHAVNFVGRVLGDDKYDTPEDVDDVLAAISETNNQDEKDFLLGLLHHAARGILGAAHGVLHLAGHIIGDY